MQMGKINRERDILEIEMLDFQERGKLEKNLSDQTPSLLKLKFLRVLWNFIAFYQIQWISLEFFKSQ